MQTNTDARYRELKTNSDVIYESINESWIEFQNQFGEDDGKNIEQETLYVVGSVLTDEFTPGESDIDVIIGTQSKTPDNIKDLFWRYWNRKQSVQTKIENNININFTKVDICGIKVTNEMNSVCQKGNCLQIE